MALTLQSGDIIELRINYVMNGQRLMNVFHYKAVEVSADLDYEAGLGYALEQLAGQPNLWPAMWAELASDQCEIYRMDLQRIFPTRSYHIQRLGTIPGIVPPSTSEPLPQNVQLSMTKVSEETGRGRTGRVEVPGGVNSAIEDGRLSTAGVNYMEDLALALQQNVQLEALLPSTLTPVILYGFAPAGSPELTLVRIQDTVRVSRRRTVGVGE